MKEKIVELKIRKGQKCWLCKKEIKKSWCYNGHWFHEKCKEKDSRERIRKYIKSVDCGHRNLPPPPDNINK